MTRERIEEIREAVVPFVKIILGKVNLGNVGNIVAEEFEKDFNEITELAINGLEKEPCEDCVSRKAVNELFNSEIKMYDRRIEKRKGSNYHDEIEQIKEFRCHIANAEYWQDKIKRLPPVTPTRKKRGDQNDI